MTSEQEALDEGPIANAATMANGLGSRIGNATMAALGNNKANGRLQTQQTVQELMKQYHKWVGVNNHDHKGPTYDNFMTWMHNTQGDKYDSVMEPVAKRLGLQAQTATPGAATTTAPNQRTEPAFTGADAKPGAAAAPAPAATAAATPATPSPQAGGKQNTIQPATPVQPFSAGAQANKSAPTRKYIDQTVNQIKGDIGKSPPNVGEMIALTKELLAHANERLDGSQTGVSTESRVTQYLKQMRKDPALMQKVPAYAKYLNSLTLESVRRSIDLACYLVENRFKMKSRLRLTEAYARFLLEDDKPLSRDDIQQLLSPVAATMINTGDATFTTPKWLGGSGTPQVSKGAYVNNGQTYAGGGNTQVQAGGNNTQATQANTTQPPSADATTTAAPTQQGTQGQPDQQNQQNAQMSPASAKMFKSKLDPNTLNAGLKSAQLDQETATGIIEIASNAPNLQTFLKQLDTKKIKLPTSAISAILRAVVM